MNSDEVNSISDTTESMQVADIVKQTYLNMMGRYDLPEWNEIVQLNTTGNDTTPTLAFAPTGISRLEWIKYFNSNPSDGLQSDQFGAYSQHDVNVDLENNANGWTVTSTSTNTIGTGTVTFTIAANQTAILQNSSAYAVSGANVMSGTVSSYSGTTLVLNITSTIGSGTYSNWVISQNNSASFGPGYQDVRFVPFEEFIRMTSTFNPSESDVGSYTFGVTNDSSGTTSNFTIYYKNDKQPDYWTILKNYYILFDSYDNTQDTTIQSSKTMAMAWMQPRFIMSDTFTPVLDDQQFPLFLADAKSLAFEELKRQPHRKAEQEVMKQVQSVQKWKAIAAKDTFFNELPNYGRRGGGYW